MEADSCRAHLAHSAALLSTYVAILHVQILRVMVQLTRAMCRAKSSSRLEEGRQEEGFLLLPDESYKIRVVQPVPLADESFALAAV